MYTLAIENTVDVPVKFTLKVGKVNKTFAFSLTAQRLEQDEITARLKDCEFKFKAFLQSEGLVSDWTGQRLVLDADGNPAPFGEASFEMMLNVPGVAKMCYEAYGKECEAKEKN